MIYYAVYEAGDTWPIALYSREDEALEHEFNAHPHCDIDIVKVTFNDENSPLAQEWGERKDAFIK